MSPGGVGREPCAQNERWKAARKRHFAWGNTVSVCARHLSEPRPCRTSSLNHEELRGSLLDDGFDNSLLVRGEFTFGNMKENSSLEYL